MKTRFIDFEMDQRAREAHVDRMANGCLVCRSARPGRLCPDCYTCLACPAGCDECADRRGGN